MDNWQKKVLKTEEKNRQLQESNKEEIDVYEEKIQDVNKVKNVLNVKR